MLESIKENRYVPKTWRKNIIHLEIQILFSFPHMQSIYRFGLYFSKSSCVGIPFKNVLFKSIWISAPLIVKLIPHTELLF